MEYTLQKVNNCINCQELIRQTNPFEELNPYWCSEKCYNEYWEKREKLDKGQLKQSYNQLVLNKMKDSMSIKQIEQSLYCKCLSCNFEFNVTLKQLTDGSLHISKWKCLQCDKQLDFQIKANKA